MIDRRACEGSWLDEADGETEESRRNADRLSWRHDVDDSRIDHDALGRPGTIDQAPVHLIERKPSFSRGLRNDPEGSISSSAKRILSLPQIINRYFYILIIPIFRAGLFL
jgi:hypothetical protein